MRRAFLACLGTALALAGCGAGEDASPRVTQPSRHVLLVVIDTLRADRLGAFGCPRETSVAIDALAAGGVRFDNVIAQSSWTAPSMVSMLTSRHLADRRITLPEGTPTLAELFRAAGFGTGGFATNPLISRENGFDRGFDRFLERRGRLEPDPRLEEWLRSRKGLPTFTYVHVTEPHYPYKPPPRLQKDERVPVTPATRAAFLEAIEQLGLDELEPALARIEGDIARYEGEVRWSDRAVQWLLGILEEIGELEGATVAIASDHGEGLWSHLDAPAFVEARLGRGAASDVATHFQAFHGCNLYQELVRVPLVLRAPALPPGTVVTSLVENVDLAPTLLELAGIAPPAEMHGRSLLDALDPERWPKRDAFTMTIFARALVTAEGMKLVEPTDFGRTAGLEAQLFDLAADPEERRNLAADRPEVVRALARRIAARAAAALPGEASAGRESVRRNLPALRALGYVGEDETELDPK